MALSQSLRCQKWASEWYWYLYIYYGNGHFLNKCLQFFLDFVSRKFKELDNYDTRIRRELAFSRLGVVAIVVVAATLVSRLRS